MIIGLTGKSCAGKNEVASLLDERFCVIDEDRLGHAVLEDRREEIRRAFGDDVILNGSVDRKRLGKIVFSSDEKLSLLNAITHPRMVEETLRQCREIEKNGKIAVINAALLESMGFVPHCDEIILVTADRETRIKRAMARDGITREKAMERFSSQTDIGLSLFSSGRKVITIFNDKDSEALSRQVNAYCATIQEGKN